jgi:hypothetical protein
MLIRSQEGSLVVETSLRFLQSLGRGPATVLLLVVVLATLGALSDAGRLLPVHEARPVPADLLMQSIVTRDGDLGWRQLCPAVQAQVPSAALHDVASTQRTAEAGQGLSLTADLVGVRSQATGGEYRFYVVTAQRPDGTVLQRTYTLTTQSDGCVEEVK